MSCGKERLRAISVPLAPGKRGISRVLTDGSHHWSIRTIRTESVASQADSAGSIPVTRSINSHRTGQPRRGRGRNWFQHYLGGKPRDEITGNARGDAPSWDVGADKTIADVIAEFDAACATSRQIAASFALDQTVPRDELGQVSLRWIYVHIIREHAQHIGHADIIREQIDGAAGD